jgi:hypothetical protein
MTRIFYRILLSSLFLAAAFSASHAGGKHPRWAGGSLQIRGFDTTALWALPTLRTISTPSSRATLMAQWMGCRAPTSVQHSISQRSNAD